MKAGVLLLLPLITLSDPDPDRNGKRGFRERIRCIDNGKFYRNPNTPRDLAFRKVKEIINGTKNQTQPIVERMCRILLVYRGRGVPFQMQHRTHF